MKILKVGSHTIELFDSIKEVTADRDHAFNSLVMFDIGVGSDPDSIGAHISKIYGYLDSEQIDAAKQETKNLNNSLYLMIAGINIRSLCWAVLVNKIDKEFCYDYSEDGITKTVKAAIKLGLRQSMIEESLIEIKKKLMSSLIFSFLINSEEEETQTFLQNFKPSLLPT